MKKGFTVEQHKQAGVKLKQVNNLLNTLYCDLRKHYTYRSRVVRLMQRMTKGVMSTKCELDDRLFQEHPQVDYINKCKTYYGKDDK